MTPRTRFIARVYARHLCLYPRKFRDKFADEMQTVFADTMADAAQRGNIVLIQTDLQEWRDLPREILREHWRARSEAIMENQPRVTWLELVCTAIPILLYLALPIVEGWGPNWGGVVILFLAQLHFVWAMDTPCRRA